MDADDTAVVGSPVDVSLHEVVVRLVDALADDVRLVQRQFPGVTAEVRAGDADVVVRFVDSMPTCGVVRRAGSDAVDDAGLIVTRPGSGRSARARMPLTGQGDWAVICERHVLEVPHLVALIRLAALRKGLLPLHAVAFRHRGKGIAITGWSGSGKTAALLAMLAAGAVPIAAEWVLVSADGSELLGIPQPVRVKPSHIDRWPALGGMTSGGRTSGARHRLLSAVRPVIRRVAPSANAAVERALQVDVPVHQLVGDAAPVPVASLVAPLDLVVVLEDAEVPRPTVEQLPAEAAVERIAVGLEHDLDELNAARRALRYGWAHPVPDVLGLEAADAAHRGLLARHVESHPVFLLRHRQPTPFDVLRAAVEEAMA